MEQLVATHAITGETVYKLYAKYAEDIVCIENIKPL
jgi:hypothetical protein